MKQNSLPAQTALLEAALTIIVDGGIDAVRYREVAKRANVSLGTVSYHFKTREDLLRASLVYYLQRCMSELVEMRKRYTSGSIEEIAAYLVEVCKKDFKDKKRRVLAEYELMVFAARDAKVAATLQEYESFAIENLSEELARASVANSASIAKTLSEMIRGFQLIGLGKKKHDYVDLYNRIKLIIKCNL